MARKQMAGERAARLLGSDGFEVIESSIPKIYLVVATSDGLIQNYDAETGRLLWSRPCGYRPHQLNQRHYLQVGFR
ncbi:MAG: hypothetical protein R3C56_35820 [Pirellulaceae bacterium]